MIDEVQKRLGTRCTSESHVDMTSDHVEGKYLICFERVHDYKKAIGG